MVLGCGCGVELVVCVSVVRVWLCFGVVVWFFGAVFGWAFGCQRACGVCSRLLEMADVSPPLTWGERAGSGGILHAQQFVSFDGAIGIIPIAGTQFTKTSEIETPSFWSDKGTSLEFTVCEARTLFRPHPQPLSHDVGEGSDVCHFEQA